MLTEEQEWSRRFASHLENNDNEDEEDETVINDSFEELGPEYKVIS